MPDVRLDESVTPAAHRAALMDALRAGDLGNRFHYVAPEAAARWQALASGHSPAHDADDGMRPYDDATAALVAALPHGPVHLVGVACADATKERRILGALAATGRMGITATAVDVSVPLVAEAAEAMDAVQGVEHAGALAADLFLAHDLPAAVGPRRPGARVVTLFGALSTLGPGALDATLPLLAPGDMLLVSGNLLPPGPDAREVVMAQYDNAPTREWLAVGMAEAGLGEASGITFRWVDDGAGAWMIVGEATPREPVAVALDGVTVSLPAGAPVRVFTSYRHEAGGLTTVLGRAGLEVLGEFTSPSGEEGVALAVARAACPSAG